MLDEVDFSSFDRTVLPSIYEKHGMFVIRGLLDRKKLSDLRIAIEGMIRDRIASVGHAVPEGDIDALFNTLCDIDRKLGAQVYDHVKDLPEYYSLLVDDDVRKIAGDLLGTDRLQVPFDICLFRIDRASEDRFIFDWHQDYPYNLISRNAVTAWYPLTDIEADMGLLKVMPGAHRRIEPIEIKNPDFRAGQGGGGKSLKMARETFDDFEDGGIEIPMRAGDVMFFHCLTPHRSGANRSAKRRARWVMNPRYGSLADPQMVNRGWNGVRRDNFFLFETLHPELIVGKDDIASSARASQ